MSKNDEPNFEDAVEAFESGDAETALDILDGLLPDDIEEGPVELIYLAAECLLDLQEPQEACHLLEIALQQAPNEPSLLHAHGVGLFELGRLGKARERFQAAADALPELGEAWFYLGILAERDGDAAGAKALWQKGVDADPENLAMPVDWSEEQVRTVWQEIVEEAPAPMSAWWAGLTVVISDLPSAEQIRAETDPISPLVHCMFEGGEKGTPAGTDPDDWFEDAPDRVVVFRKNLGKSALESAELHSELREALLWETLDFLGFQEAELEALGLLED
jgi:tetratricopeptide (TPR) repeat protein